MEANHLKLNDFTRSDIVDLTQDMVIVHIQDYWSNAFTLKLLNSTY
jgi:hypothetical protein